MRRQIFIPAFLAAETKFFAANHIAHTVFLGKINITYRILNHHIFNITVTGVNL